MDNAGWQARRRAAYQSEVASPPSRGPDGRFRPVTQIESINDVIIGGWAMPVSRHPSPLPTYPDSSKDASGMLDITPPPRFPSPNLRQTGYPFVRQLHPSMDEIPLSQHRPVERSQILQLRKNFMDPYLQFICGPLLRYDNVDEHGVWNGAALIRWMLGRCTSRIPLLSTAGTPNIPLHTIGNTVFKAHMAST